MADEKEKAIDKDQETISPVGSKKQELSEKDLEKISAGHDDESPKETIT